MYKQNKKKRGVDSFPIPGVGVAPRFFAMSFDKLAPEILLQIFSYLTASEIFTCSIVCRAWKEFLDSEDNEENGVWYRVLEANTSNEFRTSPLLLKGASYRTKLMVLENAWSEHDKSHNIYIKKDMLTLHRNPVAQSTDALRGKRGYLKGQHYWTITWHGPQLGSSAVVGVATEKEKLQEGKYTPLLGSSCESWGWDLSEGVLRHNNEELGSYPVKVPDVKVRTRYH